MELYTRKVKITFLLSPYLILAHNAGLPATFSIKRSNFGDKERSKKWQSIYKKWLFPIEKAAIVSLSDANSQEYEHLYR